MIIDTQLYETKNYLIDPQYLNYSTNNNKHITQIPPTKHKACNNDWLTFGCLCNSGIKSVHAIYINNHAEKGIKNADISSTYFCNIKANNTHTNAVKAERKFNFNAFSLEYHQWINTPKSPISCGISCKRTAKAVAIPTGIESKNAEATTNQSIKLCTISPTKFICAKGCWCSFVIGKWQWFQLIIFSIMNQSKIPHNIYNATHSEYPYSSTVSHNKCKNASHINVQAEKAIK